MANANEFSQQIDYLNGGPTLKEWGPYATKEAACLAIENKVDAEGRNMRMGKIVAIGVAQPYVLYWWKDGYTDEDMVEYFGELAPKEEFNQVKEYIDEYLKNIFSDGAFPFIVQDSTKKGLLLVDSDGFFKAAKYALKSINGNALKDGTIAASSLTQSINDIISSIPDLRSYVNDFIKAAFSEGDTPLLIKTANNKKLAQFDANGFFTAFKYALSTINGNALKDKTVGFNKLDDAVLGGMWVPMDPSTGLVLAFLAKRGNDKVILASCDINGKWTFPKLDFSLGDASVKMQNLSSDVQQLLTAGGTVNPNEKVFVDDDNGYRGKLIKAGVKTAKDGTLFKQLPRFRTPVVQGINEVGYPIEIRRSSGLVFRGELYVGTFSPDQSIQEIRYRGLNSSSTGTTLPLTGNLIGDYYKIGAPNNVMRLVNNIACYSGDLMVWSGAAWQRKPGPINVAPVNLATMSPMLGDWFLVTGAGTFDGISLSVGDHIYLSGDESMAGPFVKHYRKGSPGEFFFRGQFEPTTFNPASSYNYECYVSSGGGTYSGISFVKGDYLVRINDSWNKIPTSEITTINPNQFFNFKTDYADELEVRRLNMPASSAPAQVKYNVRSTIVQKTSSNDIVFLGDSMVAGGGLASMLVATLSPRLVEYTSWGGGTADQVLSMIKYQIQGTDPYRGRLHILFWGQNNNQEPAQTYQDVLEVFNLLGSRDKKFLFLSVLGVRYLDYNASMGRCVATTQEASFAKTGNNYEVEQFYEALCPNNYINTRKALLASAVGRNTLDPTFPGMTEEQVAATYGIQPFSYHFDWTGKPFTPQQLNFVGYREFSVVPPTGGNNFDYYLQIAPTGGPSNAAYNKEMYVNINGVWTLYGADDVHLTAAGATVLKNAIINYLNTTKL